MAQRQTEDAFDASEYEYDPDHHIDEAAAIGFMEEGLDVVVSHLTDNRIEAARMTDVGDTLVGDVLDPDNVRHIQVRARPLENPKVTVWLGDCPIWANDAWKEAFYPEGLNAYNGKVTTQFDVRPF